MPSKRGASAYVPEYRALKAPRVAMYTELPQASHLDHALSQTSTTRSAPYVDPSALQHPPATQRQPEQAFVKSTQYTSKTTRELVARTRRDPELAALVQAVTAGNGTPEQIGRFNAQVQEINSTLDRRKPEPKSKPKARYSFMGMTVTAGRSYIPPHDRPIEPGLMPKSSEPNIKPVRSPPRVHRPTAKHPNHPDSGVGSNFHAVPYPISLLPLKTWETLHNNRSEGAVCSSCRKPRPTSMHQRKMFLIAERLAWSNDIVGSSDRGQNEEALWSVNAELGIYEPTVEDDVIAIGGSQSRQNEWFPFNTEGEADVALKIVQRADVLSDRSWSAWKRMFDDTLICGSKGDVIGGAGDERIDVAQRQPLGSISGNSRWLPSTGHKTKVKGKARAIIESIDLSSTRSNLPKPSSSGSGEAKTDYWTCSDAQATVSSLKNFYSLLDKLERTSPMGAKFLEAYAERLRDEVCKDCWFKSNVLSDDALEDPVRVASQPLWTRTETPLASSTASTLLSR